MDFIIIHMSVREVMIASRWSMMDFESEQGGNTIQFMHRSITYSVYLPDISIHTYKESSTDIRIYIYIYRERETSVCVCVYTYVYIYI
jgi:hypothetical protein